MTILDSKVSSSDAPPAFLNGEASQFAGLMGPFDLARAALAESGPNCVDRANSAWLHLRHLAATELPPAFRSEWTRVSERAGRLAVPVAVPDAPARMDEAGDIGTIFLCLNWLVVHGFAAGDEGTRDD